MTPESKKHLQVPPEKIITKLSFTHLVELIKIDDPLKRTFYELECIKGTWSVRELKRQINSLYFERSGLSKKPEKLAKLVQQKTTPQAPQDIIKNIYALNFWIFPPKPLWKNLIWKRRCWTICKNSLLNWAMAFVWKPGKNVS